MSEILIAVCIVCVLAVIITIVIALRIQRQALNNMHEHHRAWQRAQEGHHRIWEETQEKRFAALEARLASQIQQLQQTWQAWEVKDAERIEVLAKEHEFSEAQAHLKHEIARLPLIEEAPFHTNGNGHEQHPFASRRPAMLQGANLSGHDLSHRYLGRADLRDAQLAQTSFFMADLSGACLAGANLSDADLAGANLSGADLRDATLTGANLLVADLNNAVLVGADLLGTRNLTIEQIYSAICDSRTQLDTEAAMTMPMPIALSDTEVPTQEERASLLSSPLVSSDNQHDPEEVDVPRDIPKIRHTEEPATTIPKRRYSGKKRAKAR